MLKNLTAVERILLEMKGYLPRLLFVLAGPSGVGKNTIIKELLTNYPSQMGRVVTYTTRPPRPSEEEGLQYHFVTSEQFQEYARAGKLMEVDPETAEGHDVYKSGQWYSMPADIYENIPEHKHLVLAEVDVEGMRRLRERYPGCVAIFVTARPEALRERIFERTDEHMTEDEFGHRMRTAYEQIRAAKEFDYIVLNETGSLKESVERIKQIIEGERMRVRHGVDLTTLMPKDSFTLPVEESN